MNLSSKVRTRYSSRRCSSGSSEEMTEASSTGRPVVLPRGDGTSHWIGQNNIIVKAGSDDTGGTPCAGEHVFEPGFARPPSHVHDTMDHTFYVLEGAPRFVVDGVKHDAGPGAFVFVPRGLAHSWGNPGGEPCRVLEVNVPGGF